MKVQFFVFIQNMSQALSSFVQVLIWEDKLDYLKNPPHRFSKIPFDLGSYEFLVMLEGKIRKCLFFYVKIFWNNSVTLVAH